MKNYYLWLLVTVMLLGASSLKSAEIIPVWNKTLGEGSIQDMQLMPGGNEFMLTTSKGEIQIRSSENGELVRSHIDTTNLFMNGYFEFTPDSNRVVMCRSGLLQIIDINTFERLNYFAFGKDSVIKGFDALVIDPIRPYVYVLLNGFSRETGDITDTRSKVQVYNYETMKLVKDLTPYGEYDYTAIAVSDDGKYLATLNNGKAYLKVWDLETMEQIRNVQLWDDKLPDNEYWCDSKDIQFSKLNSDVVFYSGLFTKQINEKRKNGVFKFNISSNLSTRIVEDGLYDGGLFIPFDNENRFFISRPFSIYVLNVLTKQIEFYQEPNSIIHASNKLIYSQKENSFIGTTNNLFDKFIYDFQTNVITDSNTEKNFISPNPTTGILNILINNKFPSIFRYDIISDSGQTILSNDIGLLQSNNNSVNINISSIPIGHYLLRISSDREIFTFNIIKE